MPLPMSISRSRSRGRSRSRQVRRRLNFGQVTPQSILRSAVRYGTPYLANAGMRGIDYLVNAARRARSTPARARSSGMFGSGARIAGRRAGARSTAGAGSRSGGFFTPSTRNGFNHYRTRHFASRKGIIGTFETGGLIADAQCVYLGHNTLPPNRLQYMMLHAIVKALFNAMGIYPVTVNLPLTNTITDDVFRITYRANSDPGTGESFFDINFTGPNTPDEIVTTIMSLTAFQNATNQITFLRAEYFPDVANTDLSYRRLILTNAKLVVKSKSSLKIQNRSHNETDDENRNEVDNVPLNGKSYEGSGNGAQYVDQNGAAAPFITHKQYGVLAKASPGGTTDEPPIPQHFTNVSKASKVQIEPGQMKTSVLFTSLTIPFYRLGFALFGDVSSGSVVYKKTNLGKYRFFSLERMIHAEAEVPDLLCAYEHNLEISAYLIGGYPSPTARIFGQNFM